MANKQGVKVNLLFEASTQSAINNLRQLGKELDNISSNTAIGVDDGALQRAVESAQQLQVHLQNAVDVDTGKIDLIKFNQSLKTAKTDLRTLSTDLQGMGTQGQQAFIKLAKAISMAETPVIKLNKKIADLGKTLLNTAKWQISSEVIHGVTGMLNEAVRHAEDLNAALSDIRVVTGASAQEMANFANIASAAARELNTTSTEYAKAALIFYQQGLSSGEVTKRTDTVIKLAQVTGQSAKIVSDQMTAIWNNFDDGTKSLERYADVLTKLGAITAASTDEISKGLEKFAAVAETVGLEYETAAAAVATVVDKTRQSADVVGTSFKTIFARMQNLELGETLEDGVNLTKYSKALEDVGVKVLDAKGQMRDMDDILNDLGEKWEGLGKTTQTAIAQTVGGIRQYNQMMALMNNWGDVQKNIEAAKESGGELAKQAAIWSESYEAAQDRLTQAKNELYESFVNDKFLIILQDLGSVLIDRFADFTKSIGGAVPLVLMLVGLFSKMLFPAIRNVFGELKQNLDVITGKAQKDVNAVQEEMRKMMQETMDNPAVEKGLKRQIELSYDLSKAREELAEKSKHMSAVEREEAEMRLHIAESVTSEIQQQLAEQSKLEKSIKNIKAGLFHSGKSQKEIKEKGRDFNAKEAIWQQERERLSTTDEGKKQLKNYTKEITAEDGKKISKIDWEQARNDFEKEFNEFLTREQNAIQLAIDKDSIDETKRNLEAEITKLKKEYEVLEAKGSADSGETMSDEEYQRYLELDEVLPKYAEQLKKITEQSEALEKQILEATETETERTKQMIELQQTYNKEKHKAVELSEAIIGTSKTENAFSQFNQAESSDSGAGKASEMMSQVAMQQLGAMPSDIKVDDINVDVSIESFTKALEISNNYRTSLQKLTTVSEEWKKNQEILVELNKKEIKAKEKLSKANEELAKAKGIVQSFEKSKKVTLEYVKALDQLKKAQNNQKKANKELETVQEALKTKLVSFKDTLVSISEKMGLSKEQTQVFTKKIDELSNSADISDDKIKEIAVDISDMIKGTANASAGIDAIIDDMGQMLIESGASAEAIDALVEQFRELGLLTPEIEQKLGLVKKQLEGLNKQPVSLGDKIEKTATGFATLAGQVTAAFGAINSIFDAFDKGNTPLETFMGLLTGLAVLIPIVVTGTKALAGATLYQNLVSALALPIMKKKKKAAEEQAAAEGKETAAKWANTAAELANQIAKGPVGMAIAAAAIVAIGATIAIIASHTKTVEKNTQKLKENNEAAQKEAEQSTELAEEWKTQSEVMDTLISQYNRLNEESEEAYELSKQICDQAPDLIQSYVDFANSLDKSSESYKELLRLANEMKKYAATGTVEGANALIENKAKADLIVAQESYNKAETALDTAFKEAKNSLAGNTDVSAGSNKITRHAGGIGTRSDATFVVQHKNGQWVEAKLNEEEYAVQMLHQAFQTGEDNISNKANSFNVELDTSSPEAFVRSYENLVNARNMMYEGLSEKGWLEHSDTYREVCEMINESKDEYESVLESLNRKNEASGVLGVTTKNSEAASGLKATNISSMSDYNKYIQGLKDYYKEDETGFNEAMNYLSTQSYLDIYTKASNKAAGLDLLNGTNVAADLDSFSNEDLELFLEVDSNIFKTTNDIKAEISRLKHEAEREEIKLNVGVTEEALDLLKETGMSEEDWNKIRESDIEWYEDSETGIKDFNTFLNASYEDQKKYLEDLRISQLDGLEDSLQAEADYLKTQKDNAELSAEARAEYAEKYQQKLDELAVRQKMNDIEAEERRREAIEALGLEVDAVDEFTKYLQENNEALTNNSALAENMSKGLLLLANSLGITTEDLMLFTTALSGSFKGDGDGIHNALKDLNATAQDTGTSLEELVNLSSNLASTYRLTGEAAVELTQYMAESSSKYDISLQEMQVHAQVLRSTYKDASGAMKLTIVEATKLAVANQRMNKGLEQLSSGWANWKKTLTTANKNTADYVATINEMTPAIRELIGATEDFVLPKGFLDVKKNIELIENAAAGSTQAIQALGIAITKAQIEDMSILDTITSNAKGQSIAEVLLDGIEEFENQLKNLKVGDVLSLGDIGNDWVTALNDMSKATQMSVDEMNAFLGQMGLSADVTVTNVETQMQVPKYETTEIVEASQDPNNDNITTYTKTSFTKQIGTQPVDATIPVATIGTEENPGSANIKYIGKDSPSTSSKSAGGSTTKPASSSKKDIAKRYRNNDKLIEDNGRLLSTAESSLDDLYGDDRITKMEEINNLIAEENRLLEKRNDDIGEYLTKDKNALNSAMLTVGLSVEYNNDGTIANEEELLTSLQGKYDKAAKDYDDYLETHWNDDGIIDATEQAELERLAEIRDKAGKDVDEAVDAMSKYNETLNEQNETIEKIAENGRKIKANNYAKIIEALDAKLESVADATKSMDYYINKLSDDFYSMSEVTSYTKDKIDLAEESLSLYKNSYGELEKQKEEGTILDSDYYEGLKKIRDGYYENLEALTSLDKEMMEYYGNTLSMASDEIVKYTDKIDNLSSVLDHYQNLLALSGQEKNYAKMGTVLEGIAKTAKNAKDASKAEYEFYKSQSESKKALYDEAIAKGDESAAELYKKEWEAAEEKTREAQDQMLSDTAAWAEAVKATISNKFNGFAQTLEQTLTGGISFDEMNTSMERATSLQEEYLTTTNQVYETTKMMRDMQKKMDETSNSVAKQKIAAFMQETEQLKTQGKLSKYELDIHKAEYDLLLAQIALEEAQSAKSTVRLQRDAEGNFGYVYTADSAKVADAEQKVADAQNALYNKQLDGANDYTQKYQQTLGEMYDTMSSLQEQYLNGEIATEEEYNRKMLEAQEYYYAKLTNYAELYQVAISDNGVIANEAWSSEFADMMTKTEDWKDAVESYIGQCKGTFVEWKNTISEIEETSGLDFQNLATKVDEITTASQNLVTELTKEDGVIKGLENELTAVSNVTTAYGKQRDAIKDLISEYETYLSTINSKIAAKGGWTINITSSPSDIDMEGFASGGYTGEWGPEGKLAVLHQKEIVLNSQDTENLLAAVETLQIILNTIDMQATSAQLGGFLSTPGFYGNDGQTLEQHVSIEASFPGVQDRYEIEEAFNNLVNKASQYANRR